MDVGSGRMSGVVAVGVGLKTHTEGMLVVFVKSACAHEDAFVLYGHVGDMHRNMPKEGFKHVLKMS